MRDSYKWFDGMVNYVTLSSNRLDGAIESGLVGMLCNIGKGDDWDATLAAVTQTVAHIHRDPRLELALDAKQLERIVDAGKVGVVLACDQSAMIGPHLWRLDVLAQLGVRHVALCYMYGELYGDGCGEGRNAGLTHLGRQYVRAVNDLPLMLDLSHCSRRTAQEALELARLPVATHTAADAVHAGRRNRTDEEIRAIAGKGGVIGVWNMPRSFADGGATVEHYVDHIQHLVNVAGIRHVGVGLDATPELEEALRGGRPIPAGIRAHFERCPDIYGTPDEFAAGRLEGFATHSDIGNVVKALAARGVGEADVQRVLLRNWVELLGRTVGDAVR